MTIVEVENREQWEEFIRSRNPNTFLQSQAWAEVQQESGEDAQFLFIQNEAGQNIGATLLLTINAKRGHFFFIPHGPIFISGLSAEDIKDSLCAIRGHCRRNNPQKATAVRFSPLLENTEMNRAIIKKLKLKPAPLHMHAELTWNLDIEKPEEEILQGMRKTTRHAIKKAQKSGVKTKISTSVEDLENFFPLYQATQTRHKFVPFPKHLIESEFKAFVKNNQAYLIITEYQGKPAAVAMLIQFGQTVFYHHGASQKLSSKVSPTQLTQWAAIKEAKKRGATRYNFWGIAPENQSNHPFAGITTFKKGFGGYPIDYIHAQDAPLSPMYYKLWLVETLRKIRRGF